MRTSEPSDAEIRRGHDHLLKTFRELAMESDDVADAAFRPDHLRPVVAFLRQSLRPFADWEEGRSGDCLALREETEFEHAFIHAECESLAGCLPGLSARDPVLRAESVRKVRKHLNRIEGLLELHVQKAADRGSTVPRVGSASSSAKKGGASLEMARPEIDSFLWSREWGVLATVGEDGDPYAVPVSFSWDGNDLLIASGPGLKRRNLESSAPVCFTVAEVQNTEKWASVVIRGTPEPVVDLASKLRALAGIHRQRSVRGGGPRDLARAAGASVFRITPREITGRRRV